jgi:class 3 adenylate cyclase
VKDWDHSAQVTSSPVLRQALVLLVAKLTGRNTRPLVMTITGAVRGERCQLQLSWKAAEDGNEQPPDARTILAKDLPGLQELARSLGGELVPVEGQPVVELALPAGPRVSAAKDLVH